MNKSTKQRREVKSLFTKEERQGVFVTKEESRERRNKLQIRKPRSKMTEEEKVVAKQRREDYENNVTEQEFKNELSMGMEREQEQEHMSCDCEFCQQEMKKFSDNPEGYLDDHWQDYLERKNYKPSEEELERYKATLEEYRKKGWLV